MCVVLCAAKIIHDYDKLSEDISSIKVDEVKATNLLMSNADSKRRPPMPVVVGVARSGTTLLRLMLDAHSQLAVTHETGFIPSLGAPASPLRRAFMKGLGLRRDTREEFQRALIGQVNWEDFHVSAESLREALREVEPFNAADGLRCFFRLYAARFGKPRWGDKTPSYCVQLKRVLSVLPEARFVHIIRDGRDASLSVRGLHFAPGQDMVTLASHWARDIHTARRQASHCTHYLEVRYEDLLLDTTAVLRRVCEFVELEYEPAMERYYTTAPERIGELLARRDRNGKVLVTREARLRNNHLTTMPPQRERIDRWKSEMSREERATFKRVAGSLLEELGYEV